MIIKSFMFVSLISILFSHVKQRNGVLSSGRYLLHAYSYPVRPDIKVDIEDSTFKEYSELNDTTSGIIQWITPRVFQLQLNNKTDTATGLLKEIYDSWGDPCYELNSAKGDTLFLRETYDRNPEITIQKAYLLKLH